MQTLLYINTRVCIEKSESVNAQLLKKKKKLALCGGFLKSYNFNCMKRDPKTQLCRGHDLYKGANEGQKGCKRKKSNGSPLCARVQKPGVSHLTPDIFRPVGKGSTKSLLSRV